jgi:hypothetical protein
MKVKFDIDCTPEEARRFLGLPDVAPMQEAVLRDAQERITAALAAMDPETLVKTWLPLGMQGWEQLQRAFWSGFAEAPAKRPRASRGEGKERGDTETKR